LWGQGATPLACGASAKRKKKTCGASAKRKKKTCGASAKRKKKTGSEKKIED